MLLKAAQDRLLIWSFCASLTAFHSQQEFFWEGEEIKLFPKWTKNWFQVCLASSFFSQYSCSCYFLTVTQVKLETPDLTNESKSTLYWCSPQSFAPGWRYKASHHIKSIGLNLTFLKGSQENFSGKCFQSTGFAKQRKDVLDKFIRIISFFSSFPLHTPHTPPTISCSLGSFLSS